MLFVVLFRWWYGSGWLKQLSVVGERLGRMIDYFSIVSLLKSLFSPFRQISAGSVQGPLDAKTRAFFDRLVSRFIGAGIRTFLIVIGSIGIVLEGLIGLLQLILWPLVPALPFLGIALWIGDWLPWR